MEQRKHWWNGHWGRIARRDVYLRTDGGLWFVEQRAGGADGVSRTYEFPSEDTAFDAVRDLLAGYDDWRELPTRF